jgi:ATP-binding cassette, subfamily C (CFTR/MRP), member 1
MGPARMAWNAKVQKRVSTISSALNQIKGIKMMGLADRISHLIQSLRVAELESSKSFRLFFVWMNMIGTLISQKELQPKKVPPAFADVIDCCS